MAQKYVLEISVETVERAVAAQSAGADRIELCADLSVGGLTPSRPLMQAVREKVRLPIFSMIRPRAGDFFYSTSEFEQMKGSIADAQEARMDGIVLGVLTSERCVDIARTRQLVEAARPLPVTFHRAFDEVARRRQALEEVIETGVQRILTSGGGKSALEGAAILAELVAAAGNRIIILPGAGITAANFSEVQKRTRATEFHSGLSAVLPYGTTEYAQFEEEVGKLAEQIARISQS